MGTQMNHQPKVVTKPKPRKPKPKPEKPQAERFREAAKNAGVTNDEGAFEKAFRSVTAGKPEKPAEKPKR